MGSASKALKKYLASSIRGGEKPKVLIVDDGALFLRNCQKILSDCGCEVSAVYTPDAGIEQFISSPFLFDVIFVDLYFPGYRGAEGGWQLTDTIISVAEERGYNVTPRLICVTGSRFNELTEAVKRHARPIVKGDGTEAVVFEVFNAIKFLDELKRGIKLIIRHVSKVHDREYLRPEARRYQFDLYPKSAALVIPEGEIEMPEVRDTPLVVLDLLAWASPQGPQRWNELLKKANASPYFKNILPTALFEDENRKYMKVLLSRLRSALRSALSSARINMEVDDVLTSYYRDPLTQKFVREEQRDTAREELKNLRNGYPALTELLTEDKNAYYQLHAWVEIENCRPDEAQSAT
jgi:CheY-like chemotaxis protein